MLYSHIISVVTEIIQIYISVPIKFQLNIFFQNHDQLINNLTVEIWQLWSYNCHSYSRKTEWQAVAHFDCLEKLQQLSTGTIIIMFQQLNAYVQNYINAQSEDHVNLKLQLNKTRQRTTWLIPLNVCAKWNG